MTLSSSAGQAEPFVSTSWFRTCNTSLWMRIAPIVNAACMDKMTSKDSCLYASPNSVNHCRPAKYRPLDQQLKLATVSISVCMQCLLYLRMDVCAIATLCWALCLIVITVSKELLMMMLEQCCSVLHACFHAVVAVEWETYLMTSRPVSAGILSDSAWAQYILATAMMKIPDAMQLATTKQPITRCTWNA